MTARGDVPPTPVPAATIILMRDTPAGFDVLLLRRHEAAVFAPGAYVFPGGRVDPLDASPSLLAKVDGLTVAGAAARLALPEGDPPAVAYYLAALREAFEETGILVGVERDSAAPPCAADDPSIDRLRRQLMDGHLGFVEVLESLECRVAGSALAYVAHWITPERSHRRFDTRFFATRVRGSANPVVDSREMTDALWIDPARALGAYARGELPMILPTIRTLERLAGYTTVREAFRAMGDADVPTILPDADEAPGRSPPTRRRKG
jgi:recombination protein RecT